MSERANSANAEGSGGAWIYTPTTDAVRDDYSCWRQWVSSNVPKSQEDGRAEFDRWLEAHDARIFDEGVWAAHDRLHARVHRGLIDQHALIHSPVNPYRSSEDVGVSPSFGGSVE